MSTPLRPRSNSDDGPESPEALMISALLDSGKFNPESFHITEEHLSCWTKLWRFCVEYQEAAGEAPPETLVRAKFPEFDIIAREVNPEYAARELHKAYSSRMLRSRLMEAIDLVKGEDVDEAYTLLEGIQRPRSARKPAINMWDYANHLEEFEVDKIPVPWDSLGRVTGGIGPAELWYIAGRPGTGKSFALVEFASAALKAGVNVGYVSCEMPAFQIHRRVLRSLAAWDPKLLAAIDSTDREVYKPAMDTLQGRTPGSLHVIDPSHGRMTNYLVRDQLDQYDLVMVDHVGLLSSNKGVKAIEDWRVMAQISNTLREDTLASGKTVIGAVQLNRNAEHGTSAPKVSDLGQSDALGQDGTIVITMRKLSESVRLWSAEKNREGAPAKWYTRFDPDKARFEQITPDLSRELQLLDEDRLAG